MRSFGATIDANSDRYRVRLEVDAVDDDDATTLTAQLLQGAWKFDDRK